jgi:hypothetical protein
MKGEPYSRVKQLARFLRDELRDCDQAYEVITLLIESAPEQTLDALCEVLDQDRNNETM